MEVLICSFSPIIGGMHYSNRIPADVIPIVLRQQILFAINSFRTLSKRQGPSKVHRAVAFYLCRPLPCFAFAVRQVSSARFCCHIHRLLSGSLEIEKYWVGMTLEEFLQGVLLLQQCDLSLLQRRICSTSCSRSWMQKRAPWTTSCSIKRCVECPALC